MADNMVGSDGSDSEPNAEVTTEMNDIEIADKIEKNAAAKVEDVAEMEPLNDGGIDHDRYPVREVEFTIPGFRDPVAFNPVVSLIGVVVLWGLCIWCMIDGEPAKALLVSWRGDITHYFSWFIVGSKAVFFFFLLYTVYKFGHIKLGRKNEAPEFDIGSYFAMIFAAGVAVGLFVYGVAEPQFHRQDHFFEKQGYRAQDEIDMFAINMTVVNWGLGAWCPYLIVAVGMGLAGFRFNLPMTFRSCFYPILGEYTWGWIGDVIDGVSIVVTVAGVCTSLGLGAIQIVAGFQAVGWVDKGADDDELVKWQLIVIWAVTAVATASVISGLNAGVKFLSKLAFGLGMVLTIFVFCMENSKFLLNLIVQETGYYLQHSMLLMNFWTDAFGQLREGEGRDDEGNSAATWWMNGWVIFYQVWWISWSVFVGMFVARISRGRTLSEVVIYSLVAPVGYCLVWFCIWGGAGLRQTRQAEELTVLGQTLFNNADHFLVNGSEFCYNVPQEDILNSTNSLADPLFINYLPGVTPVCKFDSSKSEQAAFNVLYSFSYPNELEHGFGPFLTVLFIIALAIYFATSSDSGSLIVDHLSSNGRHDHHWLQRLFWAVTEGAVATALLSGGGSKALDAVQAASIVAGLPFAFFLVYIMQSIHAMCQQADASDSMVYVFNNNERTFKTPIYGGVFNVGEIVCSMGNVHQRRRELGMHAPSQFHVVEFFVGLVVPFFSLYRILQSAYPKNSVGNALTTLAYTGLFVTWIALFATGKAALVAWAWAFFFFAGYLLTTARMDFRARYNLRSNLLGDIVSCTLLWPQVLMQMREHVAEHGEAVDEAVNGKTN